MWDQLLNIGAGLVVGAVTKKIGKSSRSGPHPVHKVGSPISAVATVAVLEGARALITGDAFNPEAVLAASLQDGGTAVAVHTVYKNGLQFLRSIKRVGSR
jgi:hypothetical protein